MTRRHSDHSHTRGNIVVLPWATTHHQEEGIPDCDPLNPLDRAMHRFVRRMEFLSMVEEWCLRNGGCQLIPCGCMERFEPIGDDGPLRLIPLGAPSAQIVPFPCALRAVLQQDAPATK